MLKVTLVGFEMTNCLSDRHVPRKPRAVPACGRQEGAQYKMMLHCREAPACLPRPNGVAVELHKSIGDIEG
jgi:hypothetical protein